jgi:hypothetical protein
MFGLNLSLSSSSYDLLSVILPAHQNAPAIMAPKAAAKAAGKADAKSKPKADAKKKKEKTEEEAPKMPEPDQKAHDEKMKVVQDKIDDLQKSQQTITQKNQ